MPCQEPIDGRYENCIFTSAHLAFSMLHMGDEARARLIGDRIVEMVGKQPALGERMYYNRFNDAGEILTSFAADDKGVKLAAIIDGNKPGQCWWSLGYPVAFLTHLHHRTGERRYLETAEDILAFVRTCDDDVRNNIVAHKVIA